MIDKGIVRGRALVLGWSSLPVAACLIGRIEVLGEELARPGAQHDR
jgi:hypothetical protein